MADNKNSNLKIKERSKQRQGIYAIFISLVIWIITVVSFYTAGYFKQLEETSLLSNTVLIGLGAGIVVFLMASARENHLYDYDNQENYGRFFLFFLLSLILSIGFSWLPAAGWSYLAIFICLSLFSNTLIGVSAGSVLLFLTVILSGAGTVTFLFYFFCGLAGAVLFGRLDENYHIGVPLISSILLMIVGETAGVVLYTNEKLGIELFLVSFMNIIITTILLMVTLKLYSSLVVHRYRNKYMEINDTECPLLIQLKQCSREEYYQAVHTAYFCDRIAKRLGLNVAAVKTGGYYHKIGKLAGENSWESVRKAGEEFGFPPAATQILREYLDTESYLIKKETAVLLFSDAIISSIMFLIARQPDTQPDYNNVIDTVFRKKLESGILNKCKLSIAELEEMRTIFKEEKLYYDFLR